MGETEYIEGMLNRTHLFMDEESVNRVRNAVFAVSGLGGVGAITAELLARWGVKRFRLLDMDRYEPSNLNRQLFATSKTIGKPKVVVAGNRIKEINPYAEIEMEVIDRVNNANVDSFVEGADIVIQNADHPSCKLFYLAARKYGCPLVNGYATITGGRVQTFDYRKTSCESFLDSWWNRFKYGDMKPLESMNPEEITEFDKQNVHQTAPSINFVTNMLGCLIVAEAVKLLTGKGRTVSYPKYLEFDTFRFKMKIKNTKWPFKIEYLKKLSGILRNKMAKNVSY
jgi:tRNA threonylcarbamoyladenosine dehydratase